MQQRSLTSKQPIGVGALVQVSAEVFVAKRCERDSIASFPGNVAMGGKLEKHK
ncbi:MAG: hypothetical protein JNM98_09635 [Rhodocyclaceae bacterium]|nr:hypothetical protein [Rhodocyclaceae bacterium]